MTDQVSDVVFIVGKQGEILWLNKAGLNLYVKSEPTNIFNLVSKAHYDRLNAIFSKVNETKDE